VGSNNLSNKAKLLIVDDEAPQMKALCNTLQNQGYTTVGVTSPTEALATLADVEFDLLLTDLMMPEMDGISLLRIAQGLNPRLVGVVMTGHGSVDTAVEAMKEGALDFLVKPFKLRTVLPVIARALQIRQLRIENAVLQKGLADRTRQLEEANRELEAFSYSVSHDLRAPLRAISGFSHILNEKFSDLLPPAGQQMLARVIQGASSMEQLTEGLIRLSRVGRQTLRRQPIDVERLISRVLEELEAVKAQRKIELHLGNLPECVGDEALLEQVWVNLLSNAYKFTATREKAIIELDSQLEEGETTYWVRDNGVGFDMQYADNLFGVFQRLHDPRQYQGTGIGLSIVQRIINRHGGRIWAQSKVGQGATFYFTLPSS
jgi:signal transduction histidine kinase